MTAITWLEPLFTNAGGLQVRAGVSGDTWYVDCSPPVTAASARGATALLPLLQQGYGGSFSDVATRLRDHLRAAALPVTVIATFPFQAIGLAALRSQWWADQLLGWLVEMPWFAEGLQELASHVDKRVLSQRFRQGLVRFLRHPHLSFHEPARVRFHMDGRVTRISLLRLERSGHGEGGVCWDVPSDSVPPHLRSVGARLVVTRWHDGTEHFGDFNPTDWTLVDHVPTTDPTPRRIP